MPKKTGNKHHNLPVSRITNMEKKNKLWNVLKYKSQILLSITGHAVHIPVIRQKKKNKK